MTTIRREDGSFGAIKSLRRRGHTDRVETRIAKDGPDRGCDRPPRVQQLV
jgi:hypothetical protein